MDIGRTSEDAWKLFVKDIGPLVIGALLVLVLSIVSLGILAGPLWGGLYRMIARRVREGRPADIGDVFSAFDRFWNLFGATLVIGILVALGLLLLILPGLLLAAIWLYVPLFIVDRNMGMGDAMRASRELVGRAGLWEHVGVVLVIAVISMMVGSITGIGFLLTWPLTVTFITALYFRASGESGLMDAAVDGGGGAASTPPAGTAAGGPARFTPPATPTGPQAQAPAPAQTGQPAQDPPPAPAAPAPGAAPD